MNTSSIEITEKLSLEKLILILLAITGLCLTISHWFFYGSILLVLLVCVVLYGGAYYFTQKVSLLQYPHIYTYVFLLLSHTIAATIILQRQPSPFIWGHLALVYFGGSLLFTRRTPLLVFSVVNVCVVVLGILWLDFAAPTKWIIISLIGVTAAIWTLTFFLLQSFIIKLRKENNRLKNEAQEINSFLDAMSHMVVYKNLDNTILKVNQAHAQFVGKTPDFFKGKSLYDLLPTDIAKRYHKADLDLVASGKPQINTLEEFETIDGRVRWVRSDKKVLYDDEGQPQGIMIFSTDVTEQVLAKGQLKQNEALFRKIFEHAPYGIIITDFELNFLNVNRKFTEITGYQIQNLIGLPLTHLSTDAQVIYDNLRKGVLDTSTLISSNIWIKTVSDEERLMTLTATVMANEEDNPMLIGFVEDITERQEAALRIDKYSKNLERSNKELEQFSYIISHDLKEPLRMIRSYIQLLNRRHKEELSADAQEYMMFIVDGATRLNNMIDDLLQYSRVGRMDDKKEHVEFSELIFNALTHLRLLINETKAEVNIVGLSPNIYCNKTKLTLVLQNLISNAIKYRNTDTIPQIDINISELPHAWQFSIRDNGIGIDKDNIDTIFLIFRRLHKRHEYSGTGVGLAICKRIIQNHDGEIWVESVIDKGSTFYFTIAKK